MAQAGEETQNPLGLDDCPPAVPALLRAAPKGSGSWMSRARLHLTAPLEAKVGTGAGTPPPPHASGSLHRSSCLHSCPFLACPGARLLLKLKSDRPPGLWVEPTPLHPSGRPMAGSLRARSASQSSVIPKGNVACGGREGLLCPHDLYLAFLSTVPRPWEVAGSRTRTYKTCS